MNYQWDPVKEQKNRKKHGIRFADAISVFMDDFAITVEDPFAEEERYITIGCDSFGRILVVVFTFRSQQTRLISVRVATAVEKRQYESGR